MVFLPGYLELHAAVLGLEILEPGAREPLLLLQPVLLFFLGFQFVFGRGDPFILLLQLLAKRVLLGVQFVDALFATEEDEG